MAGTATCAQSYNGVPSFIFLAGLLYLLKKTVPAGGFCLERTWPAAMEQAFFSQAVQGIFNQGCNGPFTDVPEISEDRSGQTMLWGTMQNAKHPGVEHPGIKRFLFLAVLAWLLFSSSVIVMGVAGHGPLALLFRVVSWGAGLRRSVSFRFFLAAGSLWRRRPLCSGSEKPASCGRVFLSWLGSVPGRQV